MSILSPCAAHNANQDSEYLYIGDDNEAWNKLATPPTTASSAADDMGAYMQPVSQPPIKSAQGAGSGEPAWLFGLIDRDTAVLHVHDPDMGGGLPGSFLFRKRKKANTYAITLLVEPGMIMHYLLRNTQRGWILNDDEDMPVIGPKGTIREIHDLLSDPRGRWKLNLRFPATLQGSDRATDLENLTNGDDASAL